MLDDRNQWIRQLLERYERPLLQYTIRILGDSERARDVVQDAFLALCKQERAKVEQHIAQWLYTVCRNRAFDVCRKEKRMKPMTNESDASEPEGNQPDNVVQLRTDSSRTLELLKTLPPQQQEVVRLKFQSDLSYREIAHVTGMSVSNVGYTIHVAIKKLKDQMTESENKKGGVQ